jgi:tRNA threonylcarbamoyl adenosine modification protein (Sua5/YciO/YrdC/YwlC family)
MDVPAAADALHRGQVVGVPTDTVYGIAADPHSEDAVCKLYEIKGRPGRKAIPVLVASVAQAGMVAEFSPEAEDYARSHWPGALTLVLPRRTVMPDWVGDAARKTVAVRMPDHPVALGLLQAAGPLAVTSANMAGEPPATNDQQASRLLGDELAGYLTGECPGRESSTVVDFTTQPPQVLRQGPVSFP